MSCAEKGYACHVSYIFIRKLKVLTRQVEIVLPVESRGDVVEADMVGLLCMHLSPFDR